jgi:hypothetical protein
LAAIAAFELNIIEEFETRRSQDVAGWRTPIGGRTRQWKGTN